MTVHVTGADMTNAPLLRKVDRVIDAVSKALAILSSMAVLAQLLTVVVDVALRAIANRPIGGVVELSAYWYMVMMTYFALAFASNRGGHIDVTLVFDKLPPPGQRFSRIVASLLTLSFLLAVGAWGWSSGLDSMAVRESAPGSALPIWPTKFAVPIGSAAMALVVLRSLASEFVRPIKQLEESAGPEAGL